MTETNDEENLAVTLLVSFNEDGSSEVRFRVGDADHSESHGPSAASAPEKKGELKPEKFSRKPHSRDAVSRRFYALGSRWTSVAIGFFDFIPDLAAKGVSTLQKEMTDALTEVASSVAHEVNEHVTDEGARHLEYQFDFEAFAVVAKTIGRSSQAMKSASILSKSALGALVSEYESFVAEMLKAVGRLQPKILLPDDATVRVADLEEYSSFEEFIEEAIDRKIEELLQAKSHIQVLCWIEEKFGVNLRSDQALIADFVEICQRRHLLAHAGGAVNKKYLQICREHGAKESELPELGKDVEVGRKYLRRATARIYQVGFFTLHILWQKLLPESIEASRQQLLRASHDFLDSDLTKMSRRVCEFALGSTRPMPGRPKAYFVINLAQSHLFDPEAPEEHRCKRVEAELRKHDWSMTSPMVDLALCCLRRDYENLRHYTEKALEDELDFSAAMTWSIFREVREIPDFIEPIQAVRARQQSRKLGSA